MNQELQRNSFFHSVEEVNQFLLWIEILRSGIYKQTTGRLQKEDAYCCLGVACDLLIPEEKKSKTNGELDGSFVNYNSQPNAPRWLNLIDAEVRKRIFYHSLTGLNDSKNLSFSQIADELELRFKSDIEAWVDLRKTEDEQSN